MANASRRNLAIIYCAAWLRSFGIGLLGVVLGVFLYRRGLSSTAIGLVIASGLAGAAAATMLMTWKADAFGRRRTLVVLSLLSALGAAALIFHLSLPAVAALSFIGMVNGMGKDRSAAYALEQAVIPKLVSDKTRTWSLAWYSLLLDASGAFGALAAGIPALEQRFWHVDLDTAYRTVLIGYAIINVVSGLFYFFLSSEVEMSPASKMTGLFKLQVSPEARSTVARLSAVFTLDSLGGGFLVNAIVSYWFFRRFGIAEDRLAVLFFVVHILNALSHLGAAALARRFGLINTMVFTHLPSSIFLIAVPLASSPAWAIALFLIRESLVQMDVPTRQSYVAAVVRPEERTFASGVTNLTRNISWAAASSVAGLLMQQVALATPLFLGGGLKIVYDLLLWRSFRHIKPPEERQSREEEQRGSKAAG